MEKEKEISLDKTYTFYFKNGVMTESTGPNAATAYYKAGYNTGELKRLDFHKEGKNDDEYSFNELIGKWIALGKKEE